MDHVQMMQAEPSQFQLSSSPSFSCYSSATETFAQIAARVIDELRRDSAASLPDDHDLFNSRETHNFDTHHHRHHHPNGNDDVDADADDFEFAFVSRDPNSSPVSADEIFYDGQIMPLYPLFDRNLLFVPSPGHDGVVSVLPISTTNNETAAVARRRRPPLRKLMLEERETGSCSSSTSEAEDNNQQDGLAAGTYCVWKPKSAAESTGRPCKKSNWTGSESKRWKLRDLLLRSHSDGKEPLLCLGSSKGVKVAQELMPKPSSTDDNGAAAVATAKEGDHHQTKRKFVLPYRQELVGLFANVNGLNRNLNPF